MNHSLANRGPITISWKGQKYTLPRFPRREWLAWGSEIDAARIEAGTRGLTPVDRGRFLSLYAPPAIDHRGLVAHMLSLGGTERVVRRCCELAGMDKAVADDILNSDGVPQADLEALAAELASVIDSSEAVGANGDGNGGEPAGPLASSSTPPSPG